MLPSPTYLILTKITGQVDVHQAGGGAIYSTKMEPHVIYRSLPRKGILILRIQEMPNTYWKCSGLAATSASDVATPSGVSSPSHDVSDTDHDRLTDDGNPNPRPENG
jgi:hypothetical protein